MYWIFGIVGLLLRGLSGGVVGTFFGAVIGLGLVSLILYMDKRASTQWASLSDDTGTTGAGQGHAATQTVASPPPATLQERVARLEHEVSFLCRQLAEIRGGTFAAPVDMEAAAVESPPTVTGALPAAKSPAAFVPTPQVSIPQLTPQPVPQPVSVLAPHEPDQVERAVGAARD